ncbi:hypothetical protein L211DRAFT_893606 [Terfezia boudieri ATCC MYA-4762]|uniref:Uncharacterized protein n=1 Tax=Terfezia boudieri ATCC MYA-4762 TaxID=1051890 RepID=A0A3N4LFU4_9PEZI|nr:hypothetical protein L211DRAFT_893606 [Terfezia boudieri ATCC MYA-4762]
MAPIVSCIQKASLFTLALAVLAVNGKTTDEVCAANKTCVPTPTTTLPEPPQWGLHQHCEYPRLTMCNADTSTGFIEDAIRAYYDSWNKNDPRRQFVELEFLNPELDSKDPDYEEYSRKLALWEGSFADILYDLFEKEEAWREAHPDYVKVYPTLDPIYHLPDEDPRHAFIPGICCPPDWPCKTSRFTQFDDTAYCYNANRTSYLMSEKGSVFDNDGIININKFTYIRSDGEVFSFIPKELQGGLNLSETSSTEASKTTRYQHITSTSTTVVSSTDTVPLSENATQTFGSTTTGAVTSTPPAATESSSAGSKINAQVGALPFFGVTGLLMFAGLGAFMVL